jgi:phage antirepressor YoqD-like protein
MAVQPTNEIVAEMIKKRNKGTEDCTLTSEFARSIGMNAPDLNRALKDMGILKKIDGMLQLTLKYQGMGYTKNRSAFRYNRQGQLIEIVYPVWTKKGIGFLEKKLKLKK